MGIRRGGAAPPPGVDDCSSFIPIPIVYKQTLLMSKGKYE